MPEQHARYGRPPHATKGGEKFESFVVVRPVEHARSPECPAPEGFSPKRFSPEGSASTARVFG